MTSRSCDTAARHEELRVVVGAGVHAAAVERADRVPETLAEERAGLSSPLRQELRNLLYSGPFAQRVLEHLLGGPVDLVYERTLPMAEHLHETGLFAPPVPVPEDATLQTKLLAIFGRRA